VFLLFLSLGIVFAVTASAQVRRAEPSPAGSSGSLVKIVGTARVNMADLARLEAMGLAPKPPVRALVRDERAEEGMEPNEMDIEPGAGAIGWLGPENMAPPPPFMPFVASPSPTSSFMGLDDVPMADSNYIIIPPDIAGGVGPAKVMESFNNNYRIRDKVTGATQLTVGTATFWNPVVTNKALLNQLTDPRTVYDPVNNRWIVAMQTVNSNGLILFGVSQTSDPAGSWFLYALTLSGSYLIDFPILGFNKNWICVSINRYTAGGAFSFGVQVVGDYAAARGGTLSSVSIFNGAAGARFCASPCVTLTNTDTLYIVTHLGSAGATYQVDRITGTPAAPVYTSGVTQTRAGGGWTQPSGQLLPQSAPVSGASSCGATPCPIETQDAQVRSAPVLRIDSTTGRQFIYYTQTIQLSGPTRTAVQWTKITTATSVVAAIADGGRIDDATAANWYAFPHIAVNSVGDFIVGYSRFGSTFHPSAAYSYHVASEGLGTIRDPFIYHAGEDYYHKDFASGRNRWGDFSTAQVDPSDDQSLWTLQEYAKTRTSTDDGTTGANGSKWSSWWAAVTNGTPSVTLDPGPSLNEGNAGTTAFIFTARLSTVSASNVTVNYQATDGSATLANSDYQPAAGSIVITPGNLTGNITVLVNGDTKRESNETFTLSITGATNATVGSPSSATGTIVNDDAVPTISINDVTVSEGNAGTTAAVFTVSLSNQTDQVVTVQYQTADGTATIANADYQAASGTVTIPAKTSSATVTVLVNGDTKREGNETFVVNLTGPTNATLADPQAQGTINNDDAVPTISINDVAVTEGNAGTTGAVFTVSLSNQTDQAVTVQYQTADGTATLANADYQAASGTVTIPAKTSSATLTVLVNGDTKREGNETFLVNLTAPTNATIADTQGQGTITNDDGTPSLSIDDVTVTEGNAGTTSAVFTVSLSNQTDQAVTVDYQTADGTATLANTDYQAGGGTLMIPAKTSSATLTVLVNGDIKFEPNETFVVNLSNPVNATIADALGQGTITNDDGTPSIAINDVSVTEGNAGTVAAVFTVSLSNPSASVVTVDYQTADGTATLANADYQSASGTVTIPAKASSATVTVVVLGDTKFEGDETFFVNLSGATNATIADVQGVGTILNDDVVPSISIGDVTLAEGNAGTTAFTFSVTLSNTTDQTVTVNYQTADGSATLANNDYQAQGGSLTIPAKTAGGTITVQVNGDTKREGDETFTVNLSSPVNATIADGQGVGTITNDDGTPSITVADVKVIEGNAGTVNAVFTVSLSNTTDQKVSIDYATANGSATLANSDYAGAGGTLSIPPKTASATITVAVNGDTKFEGDETFTLDLSNPVNATIADGQAVGTISNDDAAPTISIGDVKVIEGNGGTVNAVFTVSLSNTTDQKVSVDYATADASATIANGDYAGTSGTLSIPPKTASATITVTVNGDTRFESDETFTVSLSNAVNASIADGQAVGTISNDDGQPTLSIGDATVTEGNGGTVGAVFTISLSSPAGVPVSVDWATADGSATTANNDYAAAGGTATIPAKQLSVTVTVMVSADIANEGDETFAVNLSNAVNASIGDGSGLGTIVDDDLGPQVTIVSPNGGEHLFTGQSYKVSWGASDVASKTIVGVDLYVSLDNGAHYLVVALNQANTGTYVWVPADSVQTNSQANPAPTYTARFKVVARDGDGKVGQDESDGAFAITNRAKLGVGGAGELAFALTTVRPIPAAGPVRIGFTVARAANVRLSIVDLQGRTVAVLAEGTMGAGRYEKVWEHGGDVPAGVYFATYRVPGALYTWRFVVTR
jgi:uncharacterized protein (UPF0303 family)